MSSPGYGTCLSYHTLGSPTGASSLFAFMHGSYRVTPLQGKLSGRGCRVCHSRCQTSHSLLVPGKWSKAFHWCYVRNISPCKATLHETDQVSLYFPKELRLYLYLSFHVHLSVCLSIYLLTFQCNHGSFD